MRRRERDVAEERLPLVLALVLLQTLDGVVGDGDRGVVAAAWLRLRQLLVVS